MYNFPVHSEFTKWICKYVSLLISFVFLYSGNKAFHVCLCPKRLVEAGVYKFVTCSMCWTNHRSWLSMRTSWENRDGYSESSSSLPKLFPTFMNHHPIFVDGSIGRLNDLSNLHQFPSEWFDNWYGSRVLNFGMTYDERRARKWRGMQANMRGVHHVCTVCTTHKYVQSENQRVWKERLKELIS